ncbi:MAG: hypothetical protein KIS89_00725 [Dokdonella sp.]|nr:hypothetical protein [Dokdonella sp.]
MKMQLLAAALAAILLPAVADAAKTAQADEARASVAAPQQLWAAWGGTLEVRWNRDLAKDLGLTISKPSDALPGLSQRGRDRFSVRANGGIEFHVVGGYFRGFDGGKLQAVGGYTMRLPNGEMVDYTDFSLVANAKDPLVLDFVGRDGQVWFYVDRMMYELLDHDSVLSVGTMDMRIAPAFAQRIGHPEVADWPIADLAMTTDVQTQGSGAMPLATSPHWHGTAAPNGGTWQADLFMKVFSMSYTRCRTAAATAATARSCSRPVRP